MRDIRPPSPFIILALTLCTAITLRATTLAQLSLEQLTSAATVVVRGKCTGAETLWRDGEIWTVTSFSAEDVWKGSLPQEFKIWTIGGRVGPITSYVPGTPQFIPGEEFVLFLEPTSYGTLSITAWGEGTFLVRRNPFTGESRVTQASASMRVFDPITGKFHDAGFRNWPLGRLKSRVIAAELDETGHRRKQ